MTPPLIIAKIAAKGRGTLYTSDSLRIIRSVDWIRPDAISKLRLNKMIKSIFMALKALLPATVLACSFQSAQAETGRPGVNTLHGMKIYNETCSSCHNEGKHGAPKLDDLASWKKRLFQGEEVLDQHALAGYLKMPKKGGHLEYTDQDIIDAVHFMIVMLRDEPAR
ncbi:Cytochrome c-555 [Methylococcales bacterium]|nr:Cytochrome c-555 [Methylococcales bacterium]